VGVGSSPTPVINNRAVANLNLAVLRVLSLISSPVSIENVTTRAHE